MHKVRDYSTSVVGGLEFVSGQVLLRRPGLSRPFPRFEITKMPCWARVASPGGNGHLAANVGFSDAKVSHNGQSIQLYITRS